jgi:hypothetical protein
VIEGGDGQHGLGIGQARQSGKRQQGRSLTVANSGVAPYR